MQLAGPQSGLADRLSADLYRANAFRITGLAVDATDREISRHLEKLRMAQRLGAAMPDGTLLLPLTPAPSADAIAEAAQRLRDPDARLIDQFFWFWSDDEASAPALTLLRSGRVADAVEAWRQASQNGQEPTSQHNLAVLLHATALDLDHEAARRPFSEGEREHEARLWADALASWRALLELDGFWEVWERLASGDSRLTAALAAQFRAGLADALLTVNAQIAVAAARRGDRVHAILHGSLLERSGFEGSCVERARRRAAQPLIHSIASLCKQTPTAATGEPSQGRDAVARLLADATSALSSLATILPRDHPLLNASADQVLTTAQGPLVAYANSTDDWSGVLPLVAQCFNLPGGRASRERAEKDVATVVGNIVADHTESIAKGGSTPQQALASLSKLAAWIGEVRHAGYVSEVACAAVYDSVAHAACAVSITQLKGGDAVGADQALRFALTVAKNPELQAQIRQGLQGIANRGKRSPFKAAAAWVYLGLFGLGALSSIFGSSKRRSSPPATRPSAVRSQERRPPASDPGPSSAGTTSPRASTAPGRRLATPTNDAQLAHLEREINQGRSAISQHKRALEQFDRSLADSAAEIEGYNAGIEQMEREARAGLDVDRSRYELLVATQNEAVERHNATLVLRRARYAQYQDALRETNGRIDQYNRLNQ